MFERLTKRVLMPPLSAIARNRLPGDGTGIFRARKRTKGQGK